MRRTLLARSLSETMETILRRTTYEKRHIAKSYATPKK